MSGSPRTASAISAGVILWSIAWNGFLAPLNQVLPDTAQGIFGLIWIAYPLTLIPLLWKQEDGTALLLFLMVCVWSGDTAALYVGRAFGNDRANFSAPASEITVKEFPEMDCTVPTTLAAED